MMVDKKKQAEFEKSLDALLDPDFAATICYEENNDLDTDPVEVVICDRTGTVEARYECE